MLDLNVAIKAALGDSFSITHAGRSGNVSVTVNVGYRGTDDGLTIPIVTIGPQFGTSEFSDIGASAQSNETHSDLLIETIDSDVWHGEKMRAEIHDKLEELLWAVRKTLGGSHASLITTFRDANPVKPPGSTFFSYSRAISVRGQNFEKP